MALRKTLVAGAIILVAAGCSDDMATDQTISKPEEPAVERAVGPDKTTPRGEIVPRDTIEKIPNEQIRANQSARDEQTAPPQGDITPPAPNRLVLEQDNDTASVEFGRSLLIHQDNLFVGTTDKNGEGVVVVYEKTNHDWKESAVIRAPQSDEYSRKAKFFGKMLSYHSGVLCVAEHGFIRAARYGETMSMVHLFQVNENGQWKCIQTIQTPDEKECLGFGTALLLTENYLFITAPYQDLGNARDNNRGSIYIYEKDDGRYHLRSMISHEAFDAGLQLGMALEFDRDKLYASTGAEYSQIHVYQKEASGWNLIERIESQLCIERDGFGRSMAIDKDIMVVGAPHSDYMGSNRGLAILFERKNNVWKEAGFLYPDEPDRVTIFGNSVSMKDGCIAVTARRGDGDGPHDVRNSWIMGASHDRLVYLFRKHSEKWRQVARLKENVSVKCELDGLASNGSIVAMSAGQSYGGPPTRVVLYSDIPENFIETPRMESREPSLSYHLVDDWFILEELYEARITGSKRVDELSLHLKTEEPILVEIPNEAMLVATSVPTQGAVRLRPTLIVVKPQSLLFDQDILASPFPAYSVLSVERWHERDLDYLPFYVGNESILQFVDYCYRHETDPILTDIGLKFLALGKRPGSEIFRIQVLADRLGRYLVFSNSTRGRTSVELNWDRVGPKVMALFEAANLEWGEPDE